MGIYDFVLKKRDGTEVSMSSFKGKVLLIVNTATGCGFTPQYEGLEKLYEKYNKNGFEVLDFPCNQFGHQAPGNDEEIHQFCTMKYQTQFDQFAKIEVNGKNAHPLYKFLKEQKKGIMGSAIKWNFTKFLVDREGNVVARYDSFKTPEKIDAEIAKLLK